MRRFISAHAYRLRLSDGPLECKPQATTTACFHQKIPAPAARSRAEHRAEHRLPAESDRSLARSSASSRKARGTSKSPTEPLAFLGQCKTVSSTHPGAFVRTPKRPSFLNSPRFGVRTSAHTLAQGLEDVQRKSSKLMPAVLSLFSLGLAC